MRERGTRKQRMLEVLLLSIPAVLILTALLSVFLLWEPHSTEPKANVAIGELELNTGEGEGMEPQRREEMLLAGMTLEEKAAQLFLITPEALTGVTQVSAAGEMTREAFFQYPVGGIVYFTENLQTQSQTESLLSDMGNISLERLGFPVFLAMEGEGTHQVSIAGYGSFDMKELGFNLDLTGVQSGAETSGILTVWNYSPKEEITEEGLSELEKGIQEGADCVMVGHSALAETISPGTPASLAGEIVTGIIREKMGFQGVIMTAPMDQTAITGQYTSGEAAVQAILAGADLILMPEDFSGAYEEVLKAAADGTLTEERIDESVKRILRLKSKISG